MRNSAPDEPEESPAPPGRSPDSSGVTPRDPDDHESDSDSWPGPSHGTRKGALGYLNSFSADVRELPLFSRERPSHWTGLGAFAGRTGAALRLILKEKEILFFSLLQVAAIGAAYLIWVQALDWFPEEAWEDSDETTIWDWLMMLWSALCVGFAAFFIGVLSGCMGAVHFLHAQGQESTVVRCFEIVRPSILRLWGFHWLDAWFTVRQILHRLPKKDDDTTPAERALGEALYYAWKVGSVGFLPSLVLGKDLFGAGKDSLSLVRSRFSDVALLRAGYSAACWVIGILAYAGGVLYIWQSGVMEASIAEGTSRRLHEFYFVAGAPLILAVAIIQLMIRPIFLLSLCDLYSDFVREQGRPIQLPQGPGRGVAALVAFALFCVTFTVAGFALRSFLTS